MIRVLVVEDDRDKLRRVLTCLEEVPGCDSRAIDNARDSRSAKRLLRENLYDLLILDIALPEESEQIPSPNGGIKLLAEVLDRDIYNKPREVVGLTAFPEIRQDAERVLADELWHVVQYDLSSEAWVDRLQRKLRHIIVSKRSSNVAPNYDKFLAVVTALQRPELTAVLELPWEWQLLEFPTDGTIYHSGHFVKNGEQRHVIAAAAPRMGMVSAAVLTAKIIHAFRPQYMAMCGISAGFRGTCELGDLLAIDPVWDYGSGKWSMVGKEAVFSSAPHQIGLDSVIRGRLARMGQDGATLDEIRRGWTATTINTPLRLHLGPVPSGAAVIAEPSVTSLIKNQHRNALGIEMEAYGMFAACEECSLPQPKAFALKSVCDFADSRKGDEYQSYAAYTSSRALRFFVERFL